MKVLQDCLQAEQQLDAGLRLGGGTVKYGSSAELEINVLKYLHCINGRTDMQLNTTPLQNTIYILLPLHFIYEGKYDTFHSPVLTTLIRLLNMKPSLFGKYINKLSNIRLIALSEWEKKAS